MTDIQQPYPDVLGMFAAERLTVEGVLHCAIGVHPAAAPLDQPLELLALLQNLTDQPLPVRLTIRIPVRDAQGNLLNFFTPKPKLGITLAGGDCGLMRIPLTPQLPTPASKRYGVRVGVTASAPPEFKQIRPLAGGEPPRQLALSPARQTALREIAFGAKQSVEGQIDVAFNVLPGQPALELTNPQPRYEPLWTVKELQQDQQQINAMAGQALTFARAIDHSQVHAFLLEHVQNVFTDAGHALYPGEAAAIAKPLTYVVAGGLEREEAFSLAEGRWFVRLCRLMIDDPTVIQSLDATLTQLFTAIVQDAVLVSFHIVHQDTGVDFGDAQEQADYASKLVAALEGKGQVSLEHIYVPLALAGVLLNAQRKLPGENPWHTLVALQAARDVRINEIGDEFSEVFGILNDLIAGAEKLLREMRVPRD
ncbi:MAG: hypothetical protein JXQ72_08185 [Anaerolineae bacterium]|nr:hypothetical protein [Anaerolineae bacterium]